MSKDPNDPTEKKNKFMELGDGVSMEFVYIPAGDFWMGANEKDEEVLDREKPMHKVYLDAYWIGKYPVTNLQYTRLVDETNQKPPKHWVNGEIPSNKENYPAVHTSWDDTDSFTKWLSQKSNEIIKLPTEAQWEKAARGTDGRKYPWGNEALESILSNHRNYSPEPTAVGTNPLDENPYGVLDMMGKIWEWVADWYDKEYYRKSPSKNPHGPANGTHRVLRGSSWYFDERHMRYSSRNWHFQENAALNSGFRCVLLE